MTGKYLRRKPKRKPATLILGIVCKDGIVVASDSQTTWGSGKSWDAKKMTEMDYPYGKVLVAEAGAVITSSKTVECLGELAKDGHLFDKHGLRELAEKAIKKTRDDLRHQQFDCTSEEFREFLIVEELNCELMMAHYEGKEPRIDTITLNLGLANRAKSFFEAVGTGGDLASCLLTDLCTPELECNIASVIAVHVVEKVKRHDPYCGGPTKIGILRMPKPPKPLLSPPMEQAVGYIGLPVYYEPPLILSASETAEIVQMVLEVDADTKKKRADIIRDALRLKSEKRMKELLDLDELYGPPVEGYPKETPAK